MKNSTSPLSLHSYDHQKKGIIIMMILNGLFQMRNKV